MAVYGPSNAEELYHWKYKYKKRINGKWRYYYDEVNLDKSKYKTLKDAENLNKQVRMYSARSAAEHMNSKMSNPNGLQSVQDDIETGREMAAYYAAKSEYYSVIYQEVLDQLGEDTMANASAYMVNTWNGHDEFKKKYFQKLADEAAAEAEAEAKEIAENAEALAEKAKLYSDVEARKKVLVLSESLKGVQKRNPKKKTK